MPAGMKTMTISKICPVCSKACETSVESKRYYQWMHNGKYVQDVWPEQSPAWRERLISGTHEKCWAWMFPEEEEDG